METLFDSYYQKSQKEILAEELVNQKEELILNFSGVLAKMNSSIQELLSAFSAKKTEGVKKEKQKKEMYLGIVPFSLADFSTIDNDLAMIEAQKREIAKKVTSLYNRANALKSEIIAYYGICETDVISGETLKKVLEYA